MNRKLKPNEKNDILQALGLLTHIGLTMSICIIGCFLLGRFLDIKFGTGP